jgi:hypothetical protein
MAIGVSIFFAVFPDPKKDALPVILATSVWTALGASVLALFPIGPIAALLGWLLYRNGVVSRLAYAGAGALAGVAAPAFLLVISIGSMRYPTTNYAVVSESGGLFILAGFAIAGAFGGFMAGRVIRRGAAHT